MELIAAILLAGPLGYLGRTRRQGLCLYLLAWAVIFPIQTIVVHSENPDHIEPTYFIVAPGHSIEDVEEIVEQRDTYDVVSKNKGLGKAVAQLTDPRS